MARRTKFNVDKDTVCRTYNGIVFDSQLEMKYYSDVLCPLMKSGDIVFCELQKPYELQPSFIHDGKTIKAITYVADFFIRYRDGREEVVDTKGMPDSVARLKRKLFLYRYPSVHFRWISYSKKFGGWLDYETIQGLRREEKRNKNKKEEPNNGKK